MIQSIDYVAMYNVEIPKWSEVFINGKYALAGVQYFCMDEIEMLVQLGIVNPLSGQKYIEQDWVVYVINISDTNKCILYIDDTEHKHQTIPKDVYYNICRKANIMIKEYDIRRDIYTIAENCNNTMNDIIIASDLFRISPQHSSIICFKSGIKSKRNTHDKLFIKDNNGVIKEKISHSVFILGYTVYDVTNGLMGIDIYDYIQRLYEVNTSVSIDLGASNINPNFTCAFTEAENDFWVALSDKSKSISAFNYFESAKNSYDSGRQE